MPRIKQRSEYYLIDGDKYDRVTSCLPFGAPLTPEIRKKGELGTAVHKAVELHEKGTLDMDSVDDAVRPYLKSYLEAKRFYRFTVIETELTVYSRVLRLAGTVDLVADVPRFGTSLIDLKTGMISPTHPLQLAIYDVMYRTMNPGVKTSGPFGLYLRQTGFKMLNLKKEGALTEYLQRLQAWRDGNGKEK